MFIFLLNQAAQKPGIVHSVYRREMESFERTPSKGDCGCCTIWNIVRIFYELLGQCGLEEVLYVAGECLGRRITLLIPGRLELTGLLRYKYIWDNPTFAQEI
ncbi:hypothetical protein DPEC_G00226330 [Dallia pectoralis]|uniref:Uncharacterized protein n=1 Tax=Dallia pectoralis TaxID=75939 RepID=A0ACC2G108_DALPE|nr:hypothetical protein DPEC_G00226330 [Dallia pectoralis]